jgi:hypothetical protein
MPQYPLAMAVCSVRDQAPFLTANVRAESHNNVRF